MKRFPGAGEEGFSTLFIFSPSLVFPILVNWKVLQFLGIPFGAELALVNSSLRMQFRFLVSMYL